MTQRRSDGFPRRVIETINRLVRTSRQMLQETGYEPTPADLAKRLAMPLETVHRLRSIASEPIRLHPGKR